MLTICAPPDPNGAAEQRKVALSSRAGSENQGPLPGKSQGICACRQATAQALLPALLQTGSDYGAYLANEPSPLHTTTIVERCTEKLVDDWTYMRCNVSLHLWLLVFGWGTVSNHAPSGCTGLL